jgi:hypothetical protein
LRLFAAFAFTGCELDASEEKGSASPTDDIPPSPFFWGSTSGLMKSGPRPFSPSAGGLAVVVEGGAVLEPFGMVPGRVVFSFDTVGLVVEPFLSDDSGPESISIASASPFVDSSAKAWYLGRDASDWLCALEAPF